MKGGVNDGQCSTFQGRLTCTQAENTGRDWPFIGQEGLALESENLWFVSHLISHSSQDESYSWRLRHHLESHLFSFHFMNPRNIFKWFNICPFCKQPEVTWEDGSLLSSPSKPLQNYVNQEIQISKFALRISMKLPRPPRLCILEKPLSFWKMSL